MKYRTIGPNPETRREVSMPSLGALALFGLLFLLAAMGSALLLVLDVATGMHPAMFMTAGALTWFVAWWFIMPVWTRVRHRYCGTIPRAGAGLPGAAMG